MMAPAARRRTSGALSIPGVASASRSLALALAWLLALSTACAAGNRPERIVSLNLCADQLLVELVAPNRIAAVSHLGPDPQVSAAAARMRGWRTVRGDAEEVLTLDPDLVVAVAFSRPQTVALLQRLGRRVIVLPLAGSFSGIREAISTLAAALGESGRGAALIARLDAGLAAGGTVAGRLDEGRARYGALALQVGSLVSGPGSLLDEALGAAGFANAARRHRLGPGGRLPLENLVAAPPDLIVLANDPLEFRTAAADNLRHPALRALLARTAHMVLPLPSWICGGPAAVEMMARLIRARQDLEATGQPPARAQ